MVGFSSSLRELPKVEEGGGGFALLKVVNPLVARGSRTILELSGSG